MSATETIISPVENKLLHMGFSFNQDEIKPEKTKPTVQKTPQAKVTSIFIGYYLCYKKNNCILSINIY